MRPSTLSLLIVALALAAPALRAAETRAGLQVAVVVTRQCTVNTSATMQVTCTRAPSAVVQTSQNGRAAQPTPLVTTGPGVTSASFPLAAETTTVTIQF
jgi:hypothetical protein